MSQITKALSREFAISYDFSYYRILELSSCRITPGPEEHTPLEALPGQKTYR